MLVSSTVCHLTDAVDASSSLPGERHLFNETISKPPICSRKQTQLIFAVPLLDQGLAIHPHPELATAGKRNVQKQGLSPARGV